MDDLKLSAKIASSGMNAQATRLRIISENMANADSLGTTPGAKPYQRKTISFKNELDRQMGVETVKVDKVRMDKSEFGRRYDPGHPAAGEDGYVLLPNVNPLVEMMDMREAQRTYEANLKVIQTTKDMVSRTIELLR